MSETKDELYLQIINLKKYNDKLKQAMVGNCPHSRVQCGCGLHYKLPSEKTCTVCKIAKLEAELLTHQWVDIKDRLPNPHDNWEIELYDADGVCREIASTQYINDKPVYLDSDRNEIEIGTIKELYTHWTEITLPLEKEGE